MRQLRVVSLLAFFLTSILWTSGLRAQVKKNAKEASTGNRASESSVDDKSMSAGQSAPLLLPAVTYSSGAGAPNFVTAADVNGDGKLDLLVANNVGGAGSNGSVAVLLGNGDGTFQPAVSYDTGGQQPIYIVVGDLNGDGILDMAVSNSLSQTVGIFMGKGDGTFDPVVVYNNTNPSTNKRGRFPRALALVDINGDGKVDLLVANQMGRTISVILGNGDGTFQKKRPLIYSGGPDGQPSSMFLVDLNGDGKLDLLLGESSGHFQEGQVNTLYGNGDGTFNLPADIVNFFAYGQLFYAMGNLGSSPNDLAAAGGNGVYQHEEGEVAILPANQAWNAAHYYDSGGIEATGIAIADLDHDGNNDIVVSNQDGTVGALLGHGNETFDDVVLFPSGGTTPVSVATGDFNGDGRPDVVVANQGSGTVGVLLNGTGTSPTTTVLTSSQNPTQPNTIVTFTAVVSSPAGIPTGSVSFYSGPSYIGGATLVGGTASITDEWAKRGEHNITAVYSGASEFLPSTSNVVAQRIKTGKFSTYIQEGLSPNPAFVGQPVSVYIDVYSPGGSIPEGELASCYYFGGFLGNIVLSGGSGSLTTTVLPAGRPVISCVYGGDAMFRAVGTARTETIEKYSTSTTFTSSPNPVVYGEPVTYTATVMSTGPAPTGYVRITEIGKVPLVNGVATFTKPHVRAGTHTVTAEYLGTSALAKSGASVVEVSKPAPTTAAITSSANPSTAGQSVTFTATITPSTPVNSYGKVTFTAGTTTLGEATLLNDQASISTSVLPSGTTTVTVTYNGTPSFVGSSASLTQTVNPSP